MCLLHLSLPESFFLKCARCPPPPPLNLHTSSVSFPLLLLKCSSHSSCSGYLAPTPFSSLIPFSGPLRSTHTALLTWGALSLAYVTYRDHPPLPGQLLLMSPAQLDLDLIPEHISFLRKVECRHPLGGCWAHTGEL